MSGGEYGERKGGDGDEPSKPHLKGTHASEAAALSLPRSLLHPINITALIFFYGACGSSVAWTLLGLELRRDTRCTPQNPLECRGAGPRQPPRSPKCLFGGEAVVAALLFP